ncbi:uncharacterized protein METZ01_LOCUS89588, partial [marine metagenome]
ANGCFGKYQRSGFDRVEKRCRLL